MYAPIDTHVILCVKGVNNMTAKLTKEQVTYRNTYNRAHYETIRANSAKEARRIDLLRLAAEKAGVSYQAYILSAVDRALTADNVTRKDLPDTPTEE